MDWHWYVLIVVGILFGGVHKLIILNNTKKKRAIKAAAPKKPDED